MTLLEKEWFIEAPWGKLCVVAWGDCYDPPVLVCHGRLDSAAHFRPLIKLLPKRFYYIGIELPGSGKSDQFPPGLLFSGYDLVYTVQVVVKHFRWKTFIYLAHSLGCCIGNVMAKELVGHLMVDDYRSSWTPTTMGVQCITFLLEICTLQFKDGHCPNSACCMLIHGIIMLPPVMIISVVNSRCRKLFMDYVDNYHIYNGTKDGSPKYKKDEMIDKLMKTRGFNKCMAEETLDRITEQTEDGYLRFTYDQRNKVVTMTSFSKEQAKKIFTHMVTPTLTIISEESKQSGRYNNMEFLFEENSYPAKNYRVRFVYGGHDVHIHKPSGVAPYVSQFLNEGLKGLDFSSKI